MATDAERLERSFDTLCEIFDLIERAGDMIGTQLENDMEHMDREKELKRISRNLSKVYEDLDDILPGMEMELEEMFK